MRSRAWRDHVDVPHAGGVHRERQRDRAALPLGVEHRLVRLRRDRPEALRAAEIVRAVHAALPGASGSPVPIIESRVTRSASFSSLQPSVPAGRIGTTR